MEKTYQILKILIWVLVLAVVVAAAYLLYNNLSGRVQLDGLATQGTEAAEEHSPAPDFTFTNGAGEELKLSQFQGKPVVLNFWASWCGPCKSEMPAFQKAFETYGEEIHFLMMNLTDGGRETVEKAQSFLEAGAYTFPAYFDTNMEGASYYGVAAVPVTYFIDAQGRFVAWGQGALDEEMLQQGIDMLLED